MAAKKVQLKKMGKGRKGKASKAVTSSEEEILWESGQLGESTPRILEFTLWYFFTKCFGLRGRNKHHQLTFGDVVLKTDENGCEYLEYYERLTKTRDGTGKNDVRETTPRMFSTGIEGRDPVEMYKTFMYRRPETVMNADAPFYLTCIPSGKIEDHIWYYPRSMGHNYIGKLMPMAAQDAGIDKKTNHSVRKSTVKSLRKSGVPNHKIMQITGHRSLSSIEAYDRELSDDEQKAYSDVLTGKKQPKTHQPRKCPC
jgi:hypothetical protein